MLLSGSEISSTPDTSQAESLTSGVLRTFTRPTSRGSFSATSSPEWASGVMRYVGRDGRTLDLFGPALVPANLSARQAKEMGLLTSGTSGRPSSTSSKSADLQRLLESRLRARTQTLGSTLFRMTWKPWITPSGRSRFRLRASALRTSETGSTGWPTPTARDWRSESASDEFNQARWGHTRGKPLSALVTLAGWPTPMAGTPAQNGNNAAGNTDSSRKTVDLVAGWQTPVVNDARGSQYAYASGDKSRPFLKLPGQALLADFGAMPSGSGVGMKSSGQLNPEHSRWLQGLPAVWGSCAPTATRSTLSKRASSSNP
jgi:hypothetical protein